MTLRLEISLKPHLDDPAGNKTLAQFQTHGYPATGIRTMDCFLVDAPQIKDPSHLAQLAEELFVDSVLNDYSVNAPQGKTLGFDWYVEVGFKAGVTDNAARTARENLQLRVKVAEADPVASARAYLIRGDLTRTQVEQACKDLLVNNLIQRELILSPQEWESHQAALFNLPRPHGDALIQVENPSLPDLAAMQAYADSHLLALSPEECAVILAHYQDPAVRARRQAAGMPPGPTDVELECLAQTWSEHCKHKIFNAHIQYTDETGNTHFIKSLYKSYIQKATQDLRARMGKDDWCLSVFKDNAGVIRFDDHHALAFKVETHNSPSALDPYGGALTGIVGVNRDAYGTGMGAELIANTDVFCFGPPDYAGPLPGRLFHPSRIFEGVRLGVEHGGNQSGVPTVNGAILFDDCFIGKPLVFCGTLSIMPADHHGRPGWEKKASPGDLIFMVGGRIGKDGIHGATFSSLALDENSPVSAVQIGDPIIQKRMWDFLWAAKAQDLYSSVTDNGAGGLSSSVGEMAEGPHGAKLYLDRPPLKYQGLQPWEILVSEAQERMTLSVPPAKAKAFGDLANAMQVEATEIGVFTDSGLLECYYQDALVARLEMDFLHDGLPAMQLKAHWQPQPQPSPSLPELDLAATLKAVLARPDVASKENVIRQYDHEVTGGSIVKPLMGPEHDAPMDAAVIRPVLASKRGAVISNGICPKFAPYDAYHMAANALDEAIRNIIATGGSLQQLAALDNFCWPDPVESAKTPDGQHKLAQLVRACQALYDYCTGFGVPLISGKDSMKNDAQLDGKKISIKPTLLVSALAVMADSTQAVTSDVKGSGNYIYLLGDTKQEMAGSELFRHLGLEGGQVPQVDLPSAKLRYNTISQAVAQGLVLSLHDCSDGGLAVTLAEMAFGGGFGLELDLEDLMKHCKLTLAEVLFSESASRLVAEINPKQKVAFETMFQGQACQFLGYTNCQPQLVIHQGETTVLESSLAVLKSAWKQGLQAI